MILFIKKIIKILFKMPVVWRYFGPMVREDGVIVLMYHRVGDECEMFPSFSIERFKKQMQWIKRNCNVIHPDDFSESINNNSKYRPNVLITFDDGYKCCYQYAYPVLEELGIPALVFLATQPLDDGSMIWTDRVYYLIYNCSSKEISLPWEKNILNIEGRQNKNKAVSEIKRYLKNIDNTHRLKYLIDLESRVIITTKKKVSRQMLTWDEVRNSISIVSYGGHTHTHPIMSKITEQELTDEVVTCKRRIFEETGINPTSFAFPNGKHADYNSLCITVLEKHGFNLAYTTNEGLNGVATNLMEIRRVPTTAKNIEDFVWLISTSGKSK